MYSLIHHVWKEIFRRRSGNAGEAAIAFSRPNVARTSAAARACLSDHPHGMP